MGVDDIIAEQEAFRDIQEAERAQRTTETPVGTIQVNLDPLTSVEKTDLMLWLMVLQTLLLGYIAWKL